jgi:hypothetical protein
MKKGKRERGRRKEGKKGREEGRKEREKERERERDEGYYWSVFFFLYCHHLCQFRALRFLHLIYLPS